MSKSTETLRKSSWLRTVSRKRVINGEKTSISCVDMGSARRKNEVKEMDESSGDKKKGGGAGSEIGRADSAGATPGPFNRANRPPR